MPAEGSEYLGASAAGEEHRGRRRVAFLPGDGIGRDVTAEVRLLLMALAEAGLVDLEVVELDWGADRYLSTGESVPHGGFAALRGCDAIFVGALGDPRVPDAAHARDILLGMRRELDLYVNFRPVRCLDARLNPLSHVEASAIDMVFFRENTEGLYAGIGGTLRRGGQDELAVEEMVVTRRGVERIVRAACEYAQREGRRRVTLVDKASALPRAGGLWRQVFAQVAEAFPGLETETMYVDVAAHELVKNPARFDVVVTDNLFGDILTDVGAALQGGLGMAPSANLHPGGAAMFEPVHGSAPPPAGAGWANPLAAVLSFGLLLRHLGKGGTAAAVEAAVRRVIQSGHVTPDLGGTCTTAEVGRAVREAVLELCA
jgi:3-isopropylmalate dehydrogenase